MTSAGAENTFPAGTAGSLETDLGRNVVRLPDFIAGRHHANLPMVAERPLRGPSAGAWPSPVCPPFMVYYLCPLQ